MKCSWNYTIFLLMMVSVLMPFHFLQFAASFFQGWIMLKHPVSILAMIPLIANMALSADRTSFITQMPCNYIYHYCIFFSGFWSFLQGDVYSMAGKANIREWFPLVEGFNSDHRRRHARPVHPFTIFNEAGSRKRRRVALGSQTWHVGDQVDAFFQDG